MTMNHRKQFRNLIIQRTIVGIIIAVVLGSAIIAITPGFRYEAITIEPDDEISGTSGVSVLSEDGTGSYEVDLLRTNDFSHETGWSLFQYAPTPESELLYINTTNGIQVTGYNAELRMYRFLNILIEDYEEVIFSFRFQSLNGPLSCGMQLEFARGRTIIDEVEEVVEWDEGEEGVFSIEVPLDVLRARSDLWIMQVLFEIQIKFPENGIANVWDARVEAVSSAQLFSTTFNLLDTEGHPLFGTTTNRLVFAPYLNISTESHDSYSFIMPIVSDDTLFLPAGNYSLSYGWYIFEHYPQEGSFELSVTPDSETSVDIYYSVTQLSVDVNLDTLFDVRLYASFDGGYIRDLVGWYDFHSSYSSSLLFPVGFGAYSMQIRVHHQNNFAYTAEFNSSDTHHLRLTINLPLINFFGYALDIVQLLVVVVIIGVVIASIISLRHATTPLPLRNVTRNRRTLSFILLILSYFLPWVSYGSIMNTYIGQLIQVQTFSPASGLNTVRYLPGISFVYFTPNLFSFIWQFLLFWLPVLYILKQIMDDAPIRLNMKNILPPTVPGIFGLTVYLIPGSGDAEFGSLLAFVAFMVIVIEAVARRYKLYERFSRH